MLSSYISLFPSDFEKILTFFSGNFLLLFIKIREHARITFSILSKEFSPRFFLYRQNTWKRGILHFSSRFVVKTTRKSIDIPIKIRTHLCIYVVRLTGLIFVVVSDQDQIERSICFISRIN